MSWQLKSIQIGKLEERKNDKRTWTTGINKKPVMGSIQATTLGLEGDQVGDKKHHGGRDKAICCHPWAHHQHWNAYFQWDLQPGAFGENFTITNILESDVAVGDIWTLGNATVQVSQPRIPCWQQDDKVCSDGFFKLVIQTGKTGFYLRVLEEGTIEAGDAIQLIERPYPQATIVRLNRALHEPKNTELTQEFLKLEPLSVDWHEMFASRV